MEFLRQYFIPMLDVLLIATIIYQGYRLLARTRALQLIKGLIWLAVIFGLAFFLQLNTVLRIMNVLAPSLVIAIALVFQPELRQIVTRLGRKTFLPFGYSVEQDTPIEPVITAIRQIMENNRGALIVFARRVGLSNIIESGTELNASVSAPLIVSIFMYNTPLHDGALIILDNKVVAAGCVLPLSIRKDVVAAYGTRHRAGLGVAEESDAVVLIISEEKSELSIAFEGKLQPNVSIRDAQETLQKILLPKTEEVGDTKLSYKNNESG